MPGHDEALATSARIAERVEDYYESLDLGKRQFPSFQPPDEQSPEAYLASSASRACSERYGDHPPQAALDRLEHELGIINRMGFASYFLIVWDFVRFARETGIPNSARGSACGALVSYLLDLSHVDPLKYDLLFERFLDPSRSEAPDIDIDLCQDRRYEVIEYVRQQVRRGQRGPDRHLRHDGRQGRPQGRRPGPEHPARRGSTQVTKLVPQRLNITLEEAIEKEPELKRLGEDDPEIGRLLDYARRLEGLARNAGTHAAGVVIADRPLERPRPAPEAPQQGQGQGGRQHPVGHGGRREGRPPQDGLPRPAEPDQPRRRRPADRERTRASRSTSIALPLDDQETYELLQRGETKGVFQLEAPGIRDLLIKMKPDRFADLIAILALYRPGPLNGGMVDAYVNRKHGREAGRLPAPDDEGGPGRDLRRDGLPGAGDADPQPPGGHRALAGVRVHQGDLEEEDRGHRPGPGAVPRRGGRAQGSTKETAAKIFDLIVFFGGYGFNKSHSTAYALVAFQTAYLKAHYPTEFMAALLSSEMDGAERDKSSSSTSTNAGG